MGPVVVCHENEDEARGVLASRFPGMQFHYVTDPAQLEAVLQSAQPEVAFTLKSERMPGPALRCVMDCPAMRWVYVGGSGYDHLLPLDKPDITVSNAAGVLAAHLAETVTGAMLALNGNFLTYLRQQQRRQWQSQRFSPIAGKTLLIVGLGQIGARIATNARSLGMRVLATRRNPAPHPHVDAVLASGALSELLPQADFVSVHVRLSPKTHHLFDDAAFAQMRNGAFFINTSRGPVVDEAALLQTLSSGHLSGAYLDVFDQEPLPADSPLWTQPNVLITPHAADNIHGWQRQFLEHFADNLARYDEGSRVTNIVV